MANWNVLKMAVANVINTNGNQEITGQLLQNVLNNIITNVGENATFVDIATIDTNPGAPDGPVFYLATTAGIYPNFNGLEVFDGEAAIFLSDNSTWTKKVGFATHEKLSQLAEKIFELDKFVNPLSLTVSGGSLFESGTTQNITVKWNATKTGVAVTPEESILNGESVAGTSKSFTVSETTIFSVQVTYRREVANGNTTATFIAAMRFGFNGESNITESIVSSLPKQSLKTNPNGTYTLTAASNGYMWLCVPSSMIINKVTMSGFDVPIEDASAITIGGVNYKCYRSSNQLVSGTYTIVVS